MKKKFVEQRTQFWADWTGHPTSAYRLKDNSVTFQRSDFPVRGKLLAEATPVAEEQEAA